MGALTTSYEVFADQAVHIPSDFPKFRNEVDEKGKNYIKGVLEVVDISGKFWESYEVEIHWKDGFPFRFPNVFETGGKIPKIADWHVYEDTQSCCIAVLPEELIICKEGITLNQFIANEVKAYFFNQTFRRVEGYYKNGEYGHGLLGIFEYFESHLKTNGDARGMISLMIEIAYVGRPGRTHLCFCGSKNKFRKCHRDAFDKLGLIGKVQLLEFAFTFSERLGYQDLSRRIKSIQGLTNIT